MEDQLEQLELQVEEKMMMASKEQLLDLSTGIGMEVGGLDAMRKPKLMKEIRNYIEGKMGNTTEDQVEFYEKLSDALDTVRKDEAPGEEIAANSAPAGATVDMREDPTAQLAAALQSILLPKQESSSYPSSLYKLPLKIVGMIGDVKDGKGGKNNLNYINLCSQINDARQSGYKDGEIARAVKKAVAPSSHLRTYFDTDAAITLEKMLAMIRDYFREKTANELFTELGSLGQTQQENPTDFLIRGFQLRQKVLAASKVEGGMYDERLVQSTFCRAVRTGLVNDQIRTHMRSFLDPRSSSTTSDQDLLREMNMCSSEIDETLSKTKRQVIKKVTINEHKVVNQEDLSPILEGISRLKQQMDEMRERESRDTQSYARSNVRRTYSPGRTYRCKKCIETNASRWCQHCFNCGSEDHQARNCEHQKNGNGL